MEGKDVNQTSSPKQKFLDFPFLINKATIEYIAHADTRVMMVMRGLSGSGKSTVTRALKNVYGDKAVCCSADDFLMTKNGEYKFHWLRLHYAHGCCQRKSRESCIENFQVVIIDNTNVMEWDMGSYVRQANFYGYVVILVEPKTPWKFKPNELSKKNLHGVTEEYLEKKVELYYAIIPVFYGWFINRVLSEDLSTLCTKLFKQCWDVFPDFKAYLLHELQIKTSLVDEGRYRIYLIFSINYNIIR